MPSCRSAPGSPGTWTASPGCVPPPTAGPGGSSRAIGPISLRQFVGYAAGIRLRRRPRGRWDCHTPCPGTVLDAFRPVHHYALQRRLKEFRIVDICSGHHHAQWPACPVDQDAFLAPSLPPVRGIVSNSAPPPNAPSPSSNRLTAIPNLRRPTPGILLSGQPRHAPAPHPLPNAGRFGGWCCHPPDPWASGSIGRSYAYGR